MPSKLLITLLCLMQDTTSDLTALMRALPEGAGKVTYTKGDRIKVVMGDLQNLEAIVEDVHPDENRVTVRPAMDGLGEDEHLVDVAPDEIQKLFKVSSSRHGMYVGYEIVCLCANMCKHCTGQSGRSGLSATGSKQCCVVLAAGLPTNAVVSAFCFAVCHNYTMFCFCCSQIQKMINHNPPITACRLVIMCACWRDSTRARQAWSCKSRNSTTTTTFV